MSGLLIALLARMICMPAAEHAKHGPGPGQLPSAASPEHCATSSALRGIAQGFVYVRPHVTSGTPFTEKSLIANFSAAAVRSRQS